MTMFPPLESKKVGSEYKGYSANVRDTIVYEYLFNGKPHRWLDEHIANAPPNRQGYVSMGILHFFGLVARHKGVFYGVNVSDAINILNNVDDDRAIEIINSILRYNNHSLSDVYFDDEEMGYHEGKAAYRLHKIRERNPKVIKMAKEIFASKNNGVIFCEACGFNFLSAYGLRGDYFIEGHHRTWVSSMDENEKTRIEDIALLCSNCHRMIHRAPAVTVEELKEIIADNR